MGNGLNLGETFPDVPLETTEGNFTLYEYLGDRCAHHDCPYCE